MNILQDIIQQCHQRHKAALRQRKTVVTPALYKNIPYHFKVHCSRGNPVLLDDLEGADISFMPIGHAPENDRGPRDLGGDRFLKRQGIAEWNYRRWYTSWGIQIYTGIPSEREGARWHDFCFSYEAICDSPDAVLACIEALMKMTTNPLLTMTQSGGLRFSCRIPDYLHPNTDAEKFYIYKHVPTLEKPRARDVYLEIRGKNGYSRWDTRYEIMVGNLLDPPIISKEMLFVPINTLRAVLHEPDVFGDKQSEATPEPEIDVPASLGSYNLDLAKDVFLARGFSYLREDIGFHHWIRYDRDGDDMHASVWEDQGTVWVRTCTPPTALPTRAVPITDLWDDTGITPPSFDPRFPVTDKMIAVRENKLSPLAIKRQSPIFSCQESTQKVYATPKENADEIRRVLEKKPRILGVISEAAPVTDVIVESYSHTGESTCLNVASRNLAEATERRYQALNLPSFERWRARLYRWERVKEIPVDDRMANPFQHGNPCEDPERCRALEIKGGSSYKSICPMCQVYTECQARGYLSQPMALQRAKAQISPVYQLFLDPRRSESFKRISESVDGTDRICIIDEVNVKLIDLFVECVLPIDVLEKWTVSWRGSALGNFAAALLNTLQLQREPNADAIARIRAATEGFQQHEAEIIRQMCHVNVRGSVMATEAVVDTETGKELAHWTITFEGGASACIPVDTDAEEILKEKGMPCFQLRTFTPNEDIEIPMTMAQAIELGVLDTATVQKIREFPTVYRSPNWTFWHQLKRFFDHYKRDADAPMRWNNTILNFGMPPVLHPDIKRLLLISPTFSEHYLRKVFPSDEIEFVRPDPTAWVTGNRVFQIRASTYTRNTILNRESDWDVPGLSILGERLFSGLRAEIDTDLTVKHGIITNPSIVRLLADIAAKENVSFVESFKDIDFVDVDYEEVDVLWVVGMPHWHQETVWWLAQLLYGNDEEPLSYEVENEIGHYKDKRIRAVYHQCVLDTLTKVIGRAKLNVLSGKTVILLSSLELPNITDRPETLLFDWEDFQIAGGLHTLAETIRTRERFEAERDNLTGDSPREEVERIFGCSPRQANRMLKKIRGGNIHRISFRDQILFLLSSGRERKVSTLIAAIDSTPQAIGNELKKLVDSGEIVRVRRGVYSLPKD